MKISEFKTHLADMDSLYFQLPNGKFIPVHFHITEVGVVTKHFIDCGGVVREDKLACMQIWAADDFDHRLKASKLLRIFDIANPILQNQDLDIEIEYQGETIGKYALEMGQGAFQFVAKETDCLAKDKCNVPESKPKMQFTELALAGQSSCCTPGGGCC